MPRCISPTFAYLAWDPFARYLVTINDNVDKEFNEYNEAAKCERMPLDIISLLPLLLLWCQHTFSITVFCYSPLIQKICRQPRILRRDLRHCLLTHGQMMKSRRVHPQRLFPGHRLCIESYEEKKFSYLLLAELLVPVCHLYTLI